MQVTAGQLKIWVIDALAALGGSGRVPDIAKHIWDNHEAELRTSGDLFYTWQYAMRWPAKFFRKRGGLARTVKAERGS